MSHLRPNSPHISYWKVNHRTILRSVRPITSAALQITSKASRSVTITRLTPTPISINLMDTPRWLHRHIRRVLIHTLGTIIRPVIGSTTSALTTTQTTSTRSFLLGLVLLFALITTACGSESVDTNSVPDTPAVPVTTATPHIDYATVIITATWTITVNIAPTTSREPTITSTPVQPQPIAQPVQTSGFCTNTCNDHSKCGHSNRSISAYYHSYSRTQYSSSTYCNNACAPTMNSTSS